jgi:F-type H+-transporting ATPase subunit delta
MRSALALRYARALADAVGAVDPQTVVRDLQAFESALETSQDLRVALESPAVQRARKRAVVTRLAKALALSDLVRRFLMVLIDHRRTAVLAEIPEAFETVMDERLGVVRLDVVSARELTPAERNDLTAGFSRASGRQARARYTVREDLIGGVWAQVGSTVFDGSVRGQLEAIKRRLAGVGT